MSRHPWAWTLLALAAASPSFAAESGGEPVRKLDIAEFRVEGVTRLTDEEVETALMPFMGPESSVANVESARGSLEKLYSDKGYASVAVAIPPQRVRDGVVLLKVTEGKVGRLSVRGAQWFSPLEIRRRAPSLAEGNVPNLNDIVRDIYVLNQLSDRRVTPALRAGVLPGTVDADLMVEDQLPFHGSLELNNRYSEGTTHARLGGSLRYDNLWQRGHSLSLAFQVAPTHTADGAVFLGSYVARFTETPGFTLSFNASIQNSGISTLGGLTVRGRGRIFGCRGAFPLPSSDGFFHTLTPGIDVKYFGKELADDPFSTPITYVPLSLQYGAVWSSDGSQTQLNAGINLNLRGLSSSDSDFDAKRYNARGSFFALRADVSRLQTVTRGIQAFARFQGQFARDPLVPSEQMTAGGMETVRGYTEAQAAGDSGLLGTFELRSPPLLPQAQQWLSEWRVHLFADGGRITLRSPLPEQQWLFLLWSTGVGTRVRLADHLNGTLDVGVPLRAEGTTERKQTRYQFRIWGEF